MPNCITRHIPNALTCMNLFSGCIAGVMAFGAHYDLALLFIVVSAVFDFLDGMAARALKAYSPLGKDLDSLADDVSFGVAPSLVVFSVLSSSHFAGVPDAVASLMPYAAFILAVFSALRLAKFNNDTRQTSSFIGLPVPANALFWASLVAGGHTIISASAVWPWMLVGLVGLMSWLLVSEVPMFSLKFKNLSWRDNKVSFIFLLVSIPLLALLGRFGFAAAIVWYILLSLLTGRIRH